MRAQPQARQGGLASPVAAAAQQQQQQRHVGASSRRQLDNQQQRQRTLQRRASLLVVRAAGKEQPGGGSARPRQAGFDGRLEAAVPREQRPVNELQQLKDNALLSWATLELPEYAKRMAALYGGVFVLLGGPIAAQTFDPADQPLEFFLSASTGCLLVVAVAALRIFLAWKYVGDRLLTAALEYEETGWYDGQVFVKPPEVLARDRLLGTYEVKPVLARLRTTLQAAGLGLMATAVSLTLLINSQLDTDGAYGRGSARKLSQVTPTGILYSSKVKDLSDLINDDAAAEAEAAAQGGVPGYCGDRYFKAFAGGESVCDKFEKQRR